MEKLVDLAWNQGIWAALSVVLIFYILKQQEKRDKAQDERERKYQDVITDLTGNLNVVQEVKKDVEDIKDYLRR